MKKKPLEAPLPDWPLTSTLPLCTEEQTKAYLLQAKQFIKATRFYHDIRGSSELAVAEYIAYKEGYTLRDWSKNV